MAYYVRWSIPRLLTAALIPVLLLIFLAASFQPVHGEEPDQQQASLDRYEHKMAKPARAYSTLFHYIKNMRPVHHENTPAHQAEASVPLLCVSFFPVIYIILKRLLLHPLKFTSNFIGAITVTTMFRAIPSI